MDGIKYFPEEIKIENKTIVLRLDLNVPLKDKKIQDKTRISLVVPFLEKLIKKRSKIIIISHLGRPNGKRNNNFSLLPIYKYLKAKINTNVYFYTGNIDNQIKDKVSYLKSSDILLLENIRFFKEEEENNDNFAKKLSELGDIFINEAFSCCHRKQASIHKITKYAKKSYAGPLVKKEIEAINSVMFNKKKPVTCIIGGSKISTKINVISNLMSNVNNIVIVGAMANNFLVYNGYKIGKSLIEKNSTEIIDTINSNAKKFNCKIIIPTDFIVSKSFEGIGVAKKIKSINDDDIILDIGKETIKNIENIINQSNTILWNGPAGYFENVNFSKGTIAIAKKISENTINSSLISILGGGDTLSAIKKIDQNLSFTHLSTAGGAFLEYLEGKDLPGLSVLK